MNYPIWQLPASGLLIAFVAIVHVFVSHFAVGGGLFLVLTESKARREKDEGLLDYVRKHSRFFVLVTLVFGAVTGVGIWFTIGLVHPAATSSLINAFVWGWAIEWTFFVIEIAASLVYYYGWDRLTPRQHLAVGWIYFLSAWASLVVINGILTYMLTPGAWLENRAFWSGFFNPTYWPSVVIRTLGAIGLAGVYAVLTSSWYCSPELRAKLARYAVIGWILPMVIGLPLGLLWYLGSASAAGIPVGDIFGAASARAGDLVDSLFWGAAVGQPVAQRALRIAAAAVGVTFLLSLLSLALSRRGVVRVVTGGLMLSALVLVGASEWTREAIRKPFVIGSHMFVTGVRLPPAAGSAAAAMKAEDPYRLDRLTESGVLAAARFAPSFASDVSLTVAQEAERGREVFVLLCSQCHTTDGYLAMRPLVKGRSSVAIASMLDRLALPQDASGETAAWSAPGVRLATWRGRMMPPFAGNGAEKRALAVYLATISGGEIAPGKSAPGKSAPVSSSGIDAFESHCAACHGEGSDWPLEPRVSGKTEQQIYEALGRLPELNPAMPPFEGTEDERRALARHLFDLPDAPEGGKP